VLRLSGNRPEVVESVPAGRLAVDADRLVPMDGAILAARRRMMFNGVVVASIAVDGQGKVLGEPQISAPGLFETGDVEPALIAADLRRAVGELPAALKREDDALREATRSALRKAVGRRLRKRPTVEVHLLRI
jgi:ribonuclease J